MKLIACTSICSLDDEAFMCTTNVTNDDYSHEYASQEYETSQYGDDNLDMDDEGFVLKGITANYTNAEDVLICIAWKKVSRCNRWDRPIHQHLLATHQGVLRCAQH